MPPRQPRRVARARRPSTPRRARGGESSETASGTSVAPRRASQPPASDPRAMPATNVATIVLNANVVGPIAIARMRVHATCRISDTQPDTASASAATSGLAIGVAVVTRERRG